MHSTETMSTSPNAPTHDGFCSPSFPDAAWTATSFLLYSMVLLYVSYQLCKQSYAGSRNAGSRIRFPELSTSMLYVWLLYAVSDTSAAVLAYLLGGGWRGMTSVALSLYLTMEVAHSGWMSSFFRFGAYGKAICIKLCLLGFQSYLLLLYFMIEPAIAVVHMLTLSISLYEALVNIVLLIRSCRGHIRILSSREHGPSPPRREDVVSMLRDSQGDDVSQPV